MTVFGDLQFEHSGLTDIGRHRGNNEDAMLVLAEHGVFCVADGVGGSERSEMASQSVVRELESVFRAPARPGVSSESRDAESLARQALNQASAWIHERATQPGSAGMASTVVALVFRRSHPRQALALHAGDSRCYRLRGGDLECLTRDHSGAELLGIRDEQFVPEQFRNLITRAVGTHPRISLELTAIGVQPGDLFMLCSDGLNRMLPDSKIRAILIAGRDASLDSLARDLVGASNRAGGHDNITVVLAGVKEAEST